MLFTSYSFLAFLAVLLLLYYTLPRRFQWKLLLAGSWFFYFCAGPVYLIYLLTTSLTIFLAARSVEDSLLSQKRYLRAHRDQLSKEEKKAFREKQRKVRFRRFLAALLLNLGILAVLKYTNFFISNVNGLLRLAGQSTRLSFLTLAVPMGISFYTFQAVGYLIDVYREVIPAERNFFRFALFVSFFPQLVQGPISRFGDLSRTLYAEHPFDSRTICFGLQRILWGFFKKLVLADRVLTAVSTLVSSTETYHGAYTLVLMLLYTLELYADFTGGIDITIGIAQTLGIRVEENFLRPFFSKSLKEYWRRWHISMGTWFRDYIFYPLSATSFMQKVLKFSRSHFGPSLGRRIPVYLSSFAVWLATGIWHGASWNFVVWGLANWAILTLSEELEPIYQRFHRRFPGCGGTWYRAFQVLRNFALLCVLKLFDCYTSLGDILYMFTSLFTARNWHILWDGSLLQLGLSGLDFAVLAGGTCLMLAVSLVQRRGSVREQIAARPYPVRFVLWYGLFLAVLLLGVYGIGYDATQFIYNRF